MWGVQNRKPSVGGVWIFSGTTQYKSFYGALTVKQKIAQNSLQKLRKAVKIKQTHNREAFSNFILIFMYFSKKNANYFQLNFSSIHSLLLHFGYQCCKLLYDILRSVKKCDCISIHTTFPMAQLLKWLGTLGFLLLFLLFGVTLYIVFAKSAHYLHGLHTCISQNTMHASYFMLFYLTKFFRSSMHNIKV